MATRLQHRAEVRDYRSRPNASAKETASSTVNVAHLYKGECSLIQEMRQKDH